MMPLDLREFWRTFLGVFREEASETMLNRYHSNRPRTDLMVQGTGSVIARTVSQLTAGIVGETSTSRYIDFSFSIGDWYRGEKYPELAIEVENDWRELRGTLRDLCQFQAKSKVGVFYSESPAASTQDVIDALKHVADRFRRDGFMEAPTPYLVIVAPEKCDLGAGDVARSFMGYHFIGLDHIATGEWMSP
jgi:hypothetical protein